MNAHFPAPRVMPNAAHAFGGIWRLTIRRFASPMRWLIVGGMLFLLGLLATAPNSARYLNWVATFYVCFVVPILSFISAGGVARDDLKADAVDYIFTRPVRRPMFVLFRYVAHVACTQLDFLLALAVVVGVGVSLNVPGMMAAVPALLVAQACAIVAFSAFGFLCGMFTSRYVIVGLLYGSIVEVGIGNVPTQLNRISMVRQVLSILQPVLGEQRVGLGGPLAAEPLSMTTAIALLLTFSAAMLAVAALVFALKELAGASGRDA